jgi:hypothetical protein
MNDIRHEFKRGDKRVGEEKVAEIQQAAARYWNRTQQQELDELGRLSEKLGLSEETVTRIWYRALTLMQ